MSVNRKLKADSNQAAKQCTKSLEQQLAVVAEFYAHKIKPERIAFRTGIDYSLIADLINGNYQPQKFTALVNYYRRQRRQQRLTINAKQRQGVARFAQEMQINQDV